MIILLFFLLFGCAVPRFNVISIDITGKSTEDVKTALIYSFENERGIALYTESEDRLEFFREFILDANEKEDDSKSIEKSRLMFITATFLDNKLYLFPVLSTKTLQLKTSKEGITRQNVKKEDQGTKAIRLGEDKEGVLLQEAIEDTLRILDLPNHINEVIWNKVNKKTLAKVAPDQLLALVGRDSESEEDLDRDEGIDLVDKKVVEDVKNNLEIEKAKDKDSTNSQEATSLDDSNIEESDEE